MVSWLEVTLTPSGRRDGPGARTRRAVETPGMWEQFGPGAVGAGWDLALMASVCTSRAEHRSTRRSPFSPSRPTASSSSAGRPRPGRRGCADGDGSGAAHEAAARTVAFLHHPARGLVEAVRGPGEPPAGASSSLLSVGGTAGGALPRAAGAAGSQPAVSQHLKVLREARLSGARRGHAPVLRPDPAGLDAAQAWVARLADPLRTVHAAARRPGDRGPADAASAGPHQIGSGVAGAVVPREPSASPSRCLRRSPSAHRPRRLARSSRPGWAAAAVSPRRQRVRCSPCPRGRTG